MKTINDLYRHDKPREKLLAKGAGALKNYELMAVLMGIELLDDVILTKEGSLSLREEEIV